MKTMPVLVGILFIVLLPVVALLLLWEWVSTPTRKKHDATRCTQCKTPFNADDPGTLTDTRLMGGGFLYTVLCKSCVERDRLSTPIPSAPGSSYRKH